MLKVDILFVDPAKFFDMQTLEPQNLLSGDWQCEQRNCLRNGGYDHKNGIWGNYCQSNVIMSLVPWIKLVIKSMWKILFLSITRL